MALAEIQYPHSWETFTKEENFLFQINIGEEIIRVSVSARYKKYIERLVTQINKRIREALKEILVFENFCITFKYSSFKSENEVYIVLGFKAHHSYTESSESLYYSDIKRGFYTL